jgi:hypothetical protein
VASGLEDYELLMKGNRSLLAECDALHDRAKDLESELTKAHASAIENIAALEARIRSAEVHTVDVAAAGEKCFGDFEKQLIMDLVELRVLYECNFQSIGGMCSPMPENEPSVVDYIRWISAEVNGLPEVFAGMNKNFVSAMVRGHSRDGRGSIDLAALHASTADSGANILPVERDVRRAACAVLQKWWRSFGYNSVLAAIQARLREVNVHVRCLRIQLDDCNPVVSIPGIAKGN